MRYILGIDFGHGETAAAYMAVSENDQEQEVHRIKPAQIRKSTKADGRKIPSAIMKDRNGDFGINLKNGTIIISFKEKIDAFTGGDVRKKAFGAFIKEVYDRIIKHHESEFMKDGSKVDLYIASPTKWDENTQKAYKRFVEELLGRKVGWLINESDAAFFIKKSDATNGVVLVVDFGSSTIDYTLVVNNKKVDIDSISNTYGARGIEQILFEKYRNTEEYQKNKDFANIELKRTGNEHIDIDSFLMFEIRKAKELAYTEETKVIKGSLNLKDIAPECNEVKFEFRFSDFEQLICEYKNLVISDFRELKTKIDAKLAKRTINKIILSGGASIMPWVAETLQTIFGSEVHICQDDSPSYVVAEGIVRYAASQEECRKNIRSYLDGQDYLSIYSECDTIATRECITEMLPPLLSEYCNASIDFTGTDLLKILSGFFHDLTSNKEYVEKFKKTFNERLSTKVNYIVKETMKNIFGYELKSDVLIIFFEPPIISFGSEDMMKTIKSWIEHYADTFFRFSWDRPRSKNMRKRLVDGCLHASCNMELYYNEELSTMLSEEIKQEVMEAALLVFNEKQLFRTV